MLDDSGIDSEDKHSNTVFDDVPMAPYKSDTNEVAMKHMDDLEVVFRGATTGDGGSSLDASRQNSIANATSADSEDETVVKMQPQRPLNTCRILQRKLELKVERAKRNYTQHQEEHTKKSQSANMIPINRLPIPGDLEQKPLVDYKSDSSDEEEEITFFPARLKHTKKHKRAELSDTFSIQEMTIDSELDSDESGSQNLELLPPMMKSNLLEKLKSCFHCSNAS